MNSTQSNNKSQRQMLTYIAFILSFAILIFFTKSLFYSVKDSSNQKDVLLSEIEQKTKEFDELSIIQADLKTWKGKEIYDKYLIKFEEQEIIWYFYNYLKNNPWKLKINNISLNKWSINEFWITEWTINLSLTFINEQAMISMLDMLINNDKYNFFIHSFTYPIENTKQPFNVEIPLKVLYK